MKITGTGHVGDLEVIVEGHPPRFLAADDAPYTLGRLPDDLRHLFLGPRSGRADGDVSRRAMSFCSQNKVVWKVRNESERRPLTVLRRGHVVEALPPCNKTQPRRSWTVDEDGVEIELRTGTGIYRVWARRLSEPVAEQNLFPPSPTPPRPPVPPASPKDRIILAGKFLSRRVRGRAVSDKEAAARIALAFDKGLITSVTRPSPPWTDRVVEAAVVRWRQHLIDDHVTGIGGRANIDALGWWLVDGYEVITEGDRLQLPPAPEPDL